MEVNKEQDDEIFNKIKVFSSEDDKLKIIGELLSNKSSRNIIRLLIEKEMYTNEIAKKLELRPNLVIHHLQKMESIGLLEITNKRITRKGEEHRFFRIPKGMLIIPNESNEINENGFLKKIFKKGIKFMVIGFVTTMTFVLTDLHRFYNPENISYSSEFPVLVIPLTILSISLIIERIISIKKKGKINPILRI